MGLQHRKGFLHLAHQSLRGLDQMQQFCVIHLKQHTSDLSSKLGLVLDDQRVQSLTNHVLLHARLGSSQGSAIKGLRSTGGSLLLRGHAHGITDLAIVLDIGGAARSTAHLLGGHSASANATSAALGHASALVGAGSVHGATSLESTRHLSLHTAHAILGHGVSSATSTGEVGASSATHGTARHHATGHHRVLRTGRHGLTVRVDIHAHVRHRGLSHRESAHGTAHTSSAGTVGRGKVSSADIFALVKGHKKGLATDHFTVHLRDGASGLLRSAVAHKGESTTRGSTFVSHNAGASDGSERRKELAEGLVGESIIDILHIQVHSLVFIALLSLQSIHAVL
mmetsp:Transcript_74516/g.161184  ORF Transcript_74516/g.161184 Transcript_74516/m.161184 type:complete len:340 (+) Transcript_74516:90-1109(+)